MSRCTWLIVKKSRWAGEKASIWTGELVSMLAGELVRTWVGEKMNQSWTREKVWGETVQKAGFEIPTWLTVYPVYKLWQTPDAKSLWQKSGERAGWSLMGWEKSAQFKLEMVSDVLLLSYLDKIGLSFTDEAGQASAYLYSEARLYKGASLALLSQSATTCSTGNISVGGKESRPQQHTWNRFDIIQAYHQDSKHSCDLSTSRSYATICRLDLSWNK